MMLIYFAIPFVAAILILMYRVVAGPTIPDRVLAIDASTSLLCALMVLFAILYGVYLLLVVAIALALLSYIGTLVLAKYLEGRSMGE
ncbi:MAG: monovalent cation/H+ antiporter complex subunit F [Candidatus Bathyarchaeia archaeon]